MRRATQICSSPQGVLVLDHEGRLWLATFAGRKCTYDLLPALPAELPTDDVMLTAPRGQFFGRGKHKKSGGKATTPEADSSPVVSKPRFGL